MMAISDPEDANLQKRGDTTLLPSRQPAVQRFGDLLRAVYGKKRRRLKLKKGEIAVIRSALKLEASERQELLGLSALDRTLERTRELMLLCVELLDVPGLPGQIREFVSEVLRRHPAFQKQPLGQLLENILDGPTEEDVLRALISQHYDSLPWPEGSNVPTKKEAGQCRMNALWCLLLWLRVTRGTTFDRIQRYLYTSIRGPSARLQKTDSQKLRVLMNVRDPAAIAVACESLEKQVFEQDQQATAARIGEERAVLRATALEKEVARVKAELLDANAYVERVTQEIASTRRTHEDELAHQRNDLEELRGLVLRRLREEVSLLEEGLHALRREPPKVHVMVDHAERALHGLKCEIKRLAGDN